MVSTEGLSYIWYLLCWETFHLYSICWEFLLWKDVVFCQMIFSASIEMPQKNMQFGVQNEAGKRWLEFCQKKTLVIANTLFQEPKIWVYAWTSSNGHYWNETDYIYYSQRWRSFIQSARTWPGGNCGSEHQLFIAKCRLKLKKVGKITSLLGMT